MPTCSLSKSSSCRYSLARHMLQSAPQVHSQHAPLRCLNLLRIRTLMPARLRRFLVFHCWRQRVHAPRKDPHAVSFGHKGSCAGCSLGLLVADQLCGGAALTVASAPRTAADNACAHATAPLQAASTALPSAAPRARAALVRSRDRRGAGAALPVQLYKRAAQSAPCAKQGQH